MSHGALMEITKDTRVSDILTEYGDIADVMEIFGVHGSGATRSAGWRPGRSPSNGRRVSIAYPSLSSCEF